MSSTGVVEALPGQREVVVVVRLLISEAGDLVYGEVVDVQTEQGRWFRHLRDLESRIRAMLGDTVDRGNSRDRSGERAAPH